MLEIKSYTNQLIAIIDNLDEVKDSLSFYGVREDDIQVGTFKYLKNKVMRDHRHIIRERTIKKTQEVLIVWKGKCATRVWDSEDNLIFKGIMKSGDFIIVYNGGVGYTTLVDNTIMLEVKLGPYNILNDDEDRELII